jgi:hypothetical protein
MIGKFEFVYEGLLFTAGLLSIVLIRLIRV